MDMLKGLNNKLAGQVGEFLVCAELGKRGFIATSFTGNVPEFDLIVADEHLNAIPIQVKTSRSDNWPTRANLWINLEINHQAKMQIDKGDTQLSNPNLIYVYVALAEPETNERDQFFILQKSDLQKIFCKNYRDWMNEKGWKRPQNYESLDNRCWIRDLMPFENNWEIIAQQLKST